LPTQFGAGQGERIVVVLVGLAFEDGDPLQSRPRVGQVVERARALHPRQDAVRREVIGADLGRTLEHHASSRGRARVEFETLFEKLIGLTHRRASGARAAVLAS
jgi:hypothetical protein